MMVCIEAFDMTNFFPRAAQMETIQLPTRAGAEPEVPDSQPVVTRAKEEIRAAEKEKLKEKEAKLFMHNGRLLLLRSLALKALSVMFHHKPSAYYNLTVRLCRNSSSTWHCANRISGFAPECHLEERRNELLRRLHEAMRLGQNVFKPALIAEDESGADGADAVAAAQAESNDAKFWHEAEARRKRRIEEEKEAKAAAEAAITPAVGRRKDLQQIWPTLLDLKHTLCLFASAHCSEMVMIPTQLLNGL